MNFFQVLIICALACNTVLALIVYTTHRLRAPNRSFGVLSITATFWLGAMGMGATATTGGELAFWIRQSSVFGAAMPICVDLLRLSVLDPEAQITKLIWRLRKWLLIYVPTVVLCQTAFFMTSAGLPELPQAVGVPSYGPGIAFYVLYHAMASIYLITRFVHDSRHTKGLRHLEMQFLKLGCASGLVFGVLMVSVPVFTSISDMVGLMPISVIVLDCFVAYGIATRRIMGVSDVLRHLTAYVLMGFYLAVTYGIAYATLRFLLSPLPNSTFFVNLLSTVTVALSLLPASAWMERVAAHLFPSSTSASLPRTMDRALDVLQSVDTMDTLLSRFTDVVAQALNADRVAILLPDGKDFRQRFPAGNRTAPVSLRPYDAVVVSLQSSREPIVADLVGRMSSDSVLTEAGRDLSNLDMQVAVGIYAKSGMQGIMLLGKRSTGRIYGRIEQRLLQSLANQLAVALENARLYTRLQDSKIYDEILLDSLTSGVLAINSDRVVTMFNREAQRVTGLSPGDVLGKSTDVLPEALARVACAAIATGSGVRDEDVEMRSAAGDPVPVRLSSAVFRGRSKSQGGALVVFNDMTALRQLEDQVRQHDRLSSLGTLSAGMAHEIKNPLVSIMTFTQLLPDRYQDPEFRETFFSLIGQEVKRIDSIVNRLLKFARPARAALSPIYLHDVIDNSLHLVEEQLRKQGIKLDRSLDASRDRVLGDPDLLNQALINFFLNAMQAMESGGTLTASTLNSEPGAAGADRDNGGYVLLTIADTGNGIAEEDLPRVFDPFFSTKGNGTGLGLSVAHGIVLEHNATIDIASAMEKGTRITLRFPLIREQEVTR